MNDAKKILVVEDDKEFQNIYRQILESNGFTVVCCDTVKLGLEKMRNEAPDLVLLDIMLPGGMNGFDFLEQVKQDNTLKLIPIIVLTNLDSEAKTAFTIGAVDYVIKTNTSVDQIAEKIKKHLQ